LVAGALSEINFDVDATDSRRPELIETDEESLQVGVGPQYGVPLGVAPRETWQGLHTLDGKLASLLEVLVHEARRSFPSLHSLTLYGGTPLGEFSSCFSDINIALFSREPLTPEDTASSFGLWSRLVRDYDQLARRLVMTAVPLPGVDPRHEDAPRGFRIRSRWDDGRAMCEAFWRWPFTAVDEVSLTWHGKCLLGHSAWEFLRPSSVREALVSFGRSEVETLFLGKGGRRLFMRTFRRAGLQRSMTWMDEKRYVSTVLELTRLVQSLRENRLVSRSSSGYWFRREFGGIPGRYAADVASYRLKPEAYSVDFLSDRAKFFPRLARLVLEEASPVLYNRSLRVTAGPDHDSSLADWEHLSRAVAGQILA
jgi:hypothetical protein